MKKYIIVALCALLCTTTIYGRDTCGKNRHNHHRHGGPNKEWSAVLGFILGSATANRSNYYNNHGGYYRTVYDRRWVPGRCERVWDSCGQCYVTVRRPGHWHRYSRRVWVGH